MALQHDSSSFGTKSFSGVIIWGSGVGPKNDRYTFDPSCEGRAIGYDCDMNRFTFVTEDSFGILATEDRAGARIDRASSIIFESVMDLAFVAVHVFAWDAAKEDSRVHVFRQSQSGGLQAHICVWLEEFDMSSSTFEENSSSVAERRFDRSSGFVPVTFVCVGKNAVADGANAYISESDLAFAKLQTDFASCKASGVVVVDRLLSVYPALNVSLIDQCMK